MSTEFRDGSLPLNSKCPFAFRPNSAFNLSIGFDGLKGDAGTPYALFIADTVLIRDGPPEVLTPMSTEWNEINFTFKDDDDETEDVDKQVKVQQLLAAAGGRQRRGDADDEGKRKTNAELTKYADEEAKARLLQQSDEVGDISHLLCSSMP